MVPIANQPPKRRRGVVLTLQGWQRLEAAKRQSEIQENAGNTYTLEDLSEQVHLSINTLIRIRRRQVPVDRHSLERYFSRFNLTLDPSDYTKLDSDNIESRQKVTLKGQVPLDSPLYIERFPIEQLCYETILQPGALIRIKAPWNLKQYPELVRALTQVVMSQTPVELEPVQAFKLQSMGLVRGQNQVMPSCNLYRQYFSDRLRRLRLNLIQESRLATIVFTNVVNFAANIKADPERTQNQLYQDFQLITQLSQQFEGQILKSIGAELLIYFPSAVNAVNCAQEIQLALKNAVKLISEPMLSHRIGIHFGEVIFSVTDIIGTGVKVAECLQTEASSGGICISQSVYEAVKNNLPLQPLNIGQRQLDGIEEPIALYQLNF